MSHSKRNTSRAVFTAHERDLARRAWPSTSARLSRESFLDFSACRLCLEVARDPVSCTHGDIFCRECALSNILAQKKEIKRLEKVREQEARDADEIQAQQDGEARDRAIREFEMTQSGLDPSKPGPRNPTTTEQGAATPDRERRSGKRKFELDEDEVLRIAADDRAKARKAIDDEKAAKPTLPSFWTPSITPSSNTNTALHEVAKKAKSTPICPASQNDKPHTYSLHTLVTVQFTEEEEEEEGGKTSTSSSRRKRVRVCPSCKKGLSNASKAMMAKPCGHVMCRSCVDKFMRPAKHQDPHALAANPDELRCYVCETDLTERKGEKGKEKDKDKDKDKIRPGLVELRSEGTGFSGGGTNEVKKLGIAFQC
ncbi:Uu.00g080190.m01.CDS01 [Anthostomella pinea]|uniref:Uu.00g080190.m01.CDS01 n=1 Tax=Anthostomella pinea TaxID=933095 RepID=A0AAI8VFJ6_9PEZI|nr:Uu.00g080190.m01.CDS01 [Anthostomella pinea]